VFGFRVHKSSRRLYVSNVASTAAISVLPITTATTSSSQHQPDPVVAPNDNIPRDASVLPNGDDDDGNDDDVAASQPPMKNNNDDRKISPATALDEDDFDDDNSQSSRPMIPQQLTAKACAATMPDSELTMDVAGASSRSQQLADGSERERPSSVNLAKRSRTSAASEVHGGAAVSVFLTENATAKRQTNE
jgi:hypothetical protein